MMGNYEKVLKYSAGHVEAGTRGGKYILRNFLITTYTLEEKKRK